MNPQGLLAYLASSRLLPVLRVDLHEAIEAIASHGNGGTEPSKTQKEAIVIWMCF